MDPLRNYQDQRLVSLLEYSFSTFVYCPGCFLHTDDRVDQSLSGVKSTGTG